MVHPNHTPSTKIASSTRNSDWHYPAGLSGGHYRAETLCEQAVGRRCTLLPQRNHIIPTLRKNPGSMYGRITQLYGNPQPPWKPSRCHSAWPESCEPTPPAAIIAALPRLLACFSTSVAPVQYSIRKIIRCNARQYPANRFRLVLVARTMRVMEKMILSGRLMRL